VRVGRLDAIDHVLALDLGGRGIAGFFQPGAALAAARTLSRARRVLIVTGFCVPPGLPETDGPPGAAVLGRALGLLGATVRFMTDAPVVASLRAAVETLHFPADIEVYPEGTDPRALLAHERPTHLVAIERPGRARSGDYLSARGESVAAWNRPIDELFLLSPKTRRHAATPSSIRPPSPQPGLAAPATTIRGRGARPSARPITIAVGDGGNEIGMGNVRAHLGRESRLMARIASVVRVNHLVVAGTSNWGAYGIVAGLERLTGRPLLHTPGQERRLIEACVEAGAVDGILRSSKPTVDGLPLEIHAAVVELLRLAAPSLHERRAAIGLEARSSMMEAP
jgi:hypothetical protein